MPSRSRSDANASLTVRRATRADAGTIARIGHGLNLHQHDPTRYFTRAAVLRDGFGRHPKFTVFLAFQGERAIGYALLVCSYETGFAERGLYLQDLFVHEDARGTGAGRALVAAAARSRAARRRLSLVYRACMESQRARILPPHRGGRDSAHGLQLDRPRFLAACARSKGKAAIPRMRGQTRCW